MILTEMTKKATVGITVLLTSIRSLILLLNVKHS